MGVPSHVKPLLEADFVVATPRDDDASRTSLGWIRTWELSPAYPSVRLPLIVPRSHLAHAKLLPRVRRHWPSAFLMRRLLARGHKPRRGSSSFFVGGNNETGGQRWSPFSKPMARSLMSCRSRRAGAIIKLAVNALLGIQIAANG